MWTAIIVIVVLAALFSLAAYFASRHMAKTNAENIWDGPASWDVDSGEDGPVSVEDDDAPPLTRLPVTVPVPTNWPADAPPVGDSPPRRRKPRSAPRTAGIGRAVKRQR